MIQVKGLTKVFPSGTRAVDNLDLSVKEGEIIGLLGPNGAGKTTTIRILSTISGFDEGEVHVAGYDVDREPHKVRESIGVVAQQTGVDYFLTGRENLVLQGHLYKMKTAAIEARVEELSQYFGLADSLDLMVSTYSGGMRRKLDIATALIHRPRLLFLDEPTLGLDIKSRKSLWQYIRELNTSFGLTILLTTHYLEEADQLAHHVAIINAGRIRITGTPEELKQSICGDAVVLELDAEKSNAREASALLEKEAYVQEVLTSGNKLHVYVENGAECVPKIMALAGRKNITIQTLSLARPTLDDVFLKYTGTSMSETGEESGDEWWKQWAGKGGGGKWQSQWQSAEESDVSDKTEESDATASSDTEDWQKWQNKQGDESAGQNEDWQKWQGRQSDKAAGEQSQEQGDWSSQWQDKDQIKETVSGDKQQDWQKKSSAKNDWSDNDQNRQGKNNK